MKNKKQSIFKRWVLRKNSVQALEEEAHVGQEIKQELEQLALKKIFQRPEFSSLDGLNEYDEDYTGFISRGDLITHEMQRAIARLDGKKRPFGEDEVNSTEPVQELTRGINVKPS